MIAQVVIKIPLNDLFNYTIPAELVNQAKVGYRVIIPFATKFRVGIIVAIKPDDYLTDIDYTLKPIKAVADSIAVVDVNTLTFTNWIANYYLCSWGELLFQTIPSGIEINLSSNTTWQNKLNDKLYQAVYYFQKNDDSLKSNSISAKILEYLQEHKKISKQAINKLFPKKQATITRLIAKDLLIEKQERIDFNEPDFVISDKPPVKLSQEQQEVVRNCQKWLAKKKFCPFLLHGVTASGKTEVYIYLVWLCLLKKKTALILVPEIAMTPQNQKRFEEHFGNLVFVWHSDLSSSQKQQPG